jgi:hypothetical protein
MTLFELDLAALSAVYFVILSVCEESSLPGRTAGTSIRTGLARFQGPDGLR